MTTEDPIRIEAAEQLILLAQNLREAGDVQQVYLGDDGVSPTLTVAENLELIALQLDYDGCINRGSGAAP